MIAGEQRGGGNDDRSQLDGRQDDNPHGRYIGQHHDHAVAAADSVPPKKVRYLIGATRYQVVAQFQLPAIFVHDPQRCLLMAASVGVKTIQCPVELSKLGPAECLVNEFVVVAMLQKKIARTQEGVEVRSRWVWGHDGNLLSSSALATRSSIISPNPFPCQNTFKTTATDLLCKRARFSWPHPASFKIKRLRE